MEQSILTSVILPVSLAIIMLGMGLSLTLDDFKRVVQYPKAALLGAFNQLMGIEGGLAIGVMIIAACPGGTTSNLITHISKGDTALSVSLTAISTLATFFTIPFIVNFAIDYFNTDVAAFELPVAQTIGALFLITIVPVSIGMLIKRYNNPFALKMDRPVRISSVVLFVIIVIGIIIKTRNEILDFLASAGTISILLSIITMFLGFVTAKLFALNLKQAITISIESGIQNGTLAIVIATVLIENPLAELSIPPATYGLLMYIPGSFMIFYFGRRKSSE